MCYFRSVASIFRVYFYFHFMSLMRVYANVPES